MCGFSSFRKQFLVVSIGLLLAVCQFGSPSNSTVYGAVAEDTSVLAFTSDVHNDQSNYKGETRLGTWIDEIVSQYGRIDAMAFGGDMAQYNSADARFWSETQRVMDVVNDKGIAGYYTTGNHEYDHDSSITDDFYPEKNDTTRQYIQNDWAVENGPNYRIYCMGVGEASGYTFVNNAYTANQVTTLGNKLAAVDNSKPIFIITHFPLHYTAQNYSSNSRTIARASDVIDTLNNAANGGTPDDPSDDKKIIFIWGHNHSMNSPNDTHYDTIYQKGSTLQYDSSHSKELQFFYAAAGSMSDTEKDAGSGKVEGKGLVATVKSNSQITLAYHKADGTKVTKNGGPYEEIDPAAVENLTIDEAIEAGQAGAFVSVGRRLLLHTTIAPAEGTETSALIWSSSDTSVATVSSIGEVRGVSEGTATITVTLEDLVGGGTYSASLLVNVTPRTTSGTPYVLTDTLTPGKNYLIVSANSGDAYALRNDNGTVAREEVTIDGDTIYTDNEDLVFEAQGSGTTIDDLHNGDRYLKAHSDGLELLEVAGTTRPWEYNSSNHSLRNYKSGSNPSYYYVYYNNNDFTCEKSTVHTVYIFEESELPEDVTYDVTFRVENGKWDDGSTADKTVQLTGPEGSVVLRADQIPAVGGQPDTHYKEGSWNFVPDTTTTITQSTLFKYTYEYAEHSWDEGFVTTEPTCTKEGVRTFHCENCDATKTEAVDALGHDMEDHPAVAATCTAAGSSAYWSCHRCEKFFADEDGEEAIEENSWVIPAKGHSWKDDYTTDKKPTCIEKGSKSKHCSVCNAINEETITEIPEADHQFGEWSEVDASTCENAGLEQRKCEKCGFTESRNLDPDGHDWETEFTVDVEPTCTTEGSRTKPCSRCEAVTDSETIEALGHDYKDVKGSAVAATCTKAGKLADQECARCHNEKKGAELDATGHSWDNGKITIQPTSTAEGVMTFTCVVCGTKKTETIPKKTQDSTKDAETKPSGEDQNKPADNNETKPSDKEKAAHAPGSDPNQKGEDGTATGRGASAASANKAITKAKSDNDPAGSKFAPLKLRSTKQSKNSIKLRWNKVKGAKTYLIYGNACGKNNKMKKLAISKKNTYNVKKIKRKLKKGTYHKFIVVALDKNNNVVSTSKVIHVATRGGKITNPRIVIVKNGKRVVSYQKVNKGKTVKVRSMVTKANKKLALKNHRVVSYESSNPKIAKVDAKNGKIKGVKKGTCYVYAYAQNGVFKKIKVKVK